MYSDGSTRISLVVILLSLVVIAAVGCGAQPAPTQGLSPTAVPVAEEPTATEVVEPTAEEQDMGASAMEAAPEKESGGVGRARLRLQPVEDGSAVEIWVDDVVELYALDLQLEFDASKYQAADADPERDGVQLAPGEVPAPDFVALNSVDNANGAVQYVVTQLGTSEAFSGSGLVATLKWQEGVSSQGGASAEGAVSFGTVTLVDRDVRQIEVTTK